MSDSTFTINPSESDVLRGDYRILCSSILKKRENVRRARLELGIDLHRLGEHHIRKKEYKEAMHAFNEALMEKRSATSVSPESDDNILTSSTSSLMSSDCIERRNDSNDNNEQRNINEVISTLSAIGSLHSLIGEHSEAMKCYSEITSMRSFSTLSRWPSNRVCHENDDTEASDLQEEVNALDDLFRTISFRSVNHLKSRLSNSSNLNGSNYCDKSDSKTDQPWEKLNDSMKDLKDVFSNCKEIGIQIDDNDYLYISHQVKMLKDGFELNDDTESIREKSLYMCLLVRDKILHIQKHIAAYYLSQREAKDSDRSVDTSDKYLEASNNVAATMIIIGGIHYKLSNFNEELQMYFDALATYQEALGDSHPFVAGTRKNIGVLLAEKGDTDGAMKQFELAKEIYSQQENNAINSELASAISCMGNVQYRRGFLDDALILYSKALYMYRTTGEDVGWSQEAVINVTTTLKIIGMVYMNRSDSETAMKCYEEAMELLVSLNMENTVEAASLFTRMGGIFYRGGKYDEAMRHYQKAYKVATEAIGTKNNLDVASILHFIGLVHQKQSRLHDAMLCYQECVQIYRATLGPDNPAKATTTVYIGSIYFHEKRYDDAMICYKEALRLYETSYGQNHSQVEPTMKSIAMIHIKKEEYDEAMDIFQDLLRRKCIALGSYHPDIAYAHKCIGNIHIKRGETGKALRQYKHAYEIYQRMFGDTHKETKAIMSSITTMRHNLMMQQNVHRRDMNKKNIDRRNYKRRQLSASRYAY